MQILDNIQVLETLCKSTNKWGMMISIPSGSILHDDLPKAVPYLDMIKHIQVIVDGTGYMLFDSEEEMEHIYYQTVGDDGPTKLNSYNGSIKIYALTCNPNGQTMNENT